jgi:hypothetical protein
MVRSALASPRRLRLGIGDEDSLAAAFSDCVTA